MVTKYLEGVRNLRVHNSIPTVLEYYFVETEKEQDKMFGVEIIKKQSGDEKDMIVESKSLETVSQSEEIVHQIINQLIGYSVTPITLEDVIEDLTYSL